jgi:hypothetical protein
MIRASLVLAIVAACLASERAEAACGRFKAVIKEVKVTKASGGAAQAAAIGSEVCSGDSIAAGADSRASIEMEDKNILNLSPSTSIVIEAYEKKKVLLNVLGGKMRSSIAPGNKYDEQTSFQVKTKSAVAGVRGTDFVTSYAPATGKTEIVTFAGRVDVGQPGPNGKIENPVSVGPGQKTVASPGQAPSLPRPVPAAELKTLGQATASAAPQPASGGAPSEQGGGKGGDSGKGSGSASGAGGSGSSSSAANGGSGSSSSAANGGSGSSSSTANGGSGGSSSTANGGGGGDSSSSSRGPAAAGPAPVAAAAPSVAAPDSSSGNGNSAPAPASAAAGPAPATAPAAAPAASDPSSGAPAAGGGGGSTAGAAPPAGGGSSNPAPPGAGASMVSSAPAAAAPSALPPSSGMSMVSSTDASGGVKMQTPTFVAPPAPAPVAFMPPAAMPVAPAAPPVLDPSLAHAIQNASGPTSVHINIHY